jgi:SAM-dependent methyltransferase
VRFLPHILERRPPLLEPEKAYERWVGTYAPGAHNPLMRVEQETMENLLAPLRVHRALDVGTGTGRNVRVLEEARVPVALGIDRSAAMLARAREASTNLVRGDARALPFVSGAFDLVVSSLMAGDLEELGGFAREASRVLTPGGALLYSDFHPSWVEWGWERTFRDERGRRYRLSYHPHSLAHHREALAAAELELRELREPALPGLECPVLLVVHAEKR